MPSNSTILDDSLDPVCLGRCHGIVGKIKFLPESPDNLVLIADKEVVCQLHGVTVSPCFLIMNINLPLTRFSYLITAGFSFDYQILTILQFGKL